MHAHFVRKWLSIIYGLSYDHNLRYTSINSSSLRKNKDLNFDVLSGTLIQPLFYAVQKISWDDGIEC